LNERDHSKKGSTRVVNYKRGGSWTRAADAGHPTHPKKKKTAHDIKAWRKKEREGMSFLREEGKAVKPKTD